VGATFFSGSQYSVLGSQFTYVLLSWCGLAFYVVLVFYMGKSMDNYRQLICQAPLVWFCTILNVLFSFFMFILRSQRTT